MIPLGFTTSVCVLQAIIIPFHVLGCYIFVIVMDWGVVGAAWVHNVSALITIIFVGAYVSL
jgi:Na+-driven multidrug efflux pump